MLLKPDQERVKVLLKDTLTLLCKNGLEFDAKFRIEALIGITLDDKNVFLLNFDEIIKSANDDSVESGSSKETGVSPRRIRKRRRTSTADSDRSQSAGDKKSTSKLSVSASQTQHRQNENDDEVVVVKDEADDWDESIQEVEQLDFTSFDSTSLPSTSHHGNPLELSDVRLEEATDQERASAWLVHHTAGARSSVAQQLNTSAFGDVSQQSGKRIGRVERVELTPQKTPQKSPRKTPQKSPQKSSWKPGEKPVTPVSVTRMSTRSTSARSRSGGETSTPVQTETVTPIIIQPQEEDKPVVVDRGVVTDDNNTTFEIYEGASQLGTDLLVESSGYSYTKKSLKGQKDRWRCGIRNPRNTICGAILHQNGDQITRGNIPHNHPPDPSIPLTVKLRSEVLSRVTQDKEIPVTDIVNAVIQEQVDNFTKTLPPSDKLVKAGDRHRRRSNGELLPRLTKERHRVTEEDGELLDPEESSTAVDELVAGGSVGGEGDTGEEHRQDVAGRPVKYEIVKGGTVRGKDKLVDNIGYSYNFKRQRGDKIHWWCSMRCGRINCLASCTQIGNKFKRGCVRHIHPPDPDEARKVKAGAQVRNLVEDNSNVVLDDVLNNMIQVDDADPEAVKLAKLEKTKLKNKAKRLRKKLMTSDPDFTMMSSVTVEEEPQMSAVSFEVAQTSQVEEALPIHTDTHTDVQTAIPIESVPLDHQYETVVAVTDGSHGNQVVHQYQIPNQDMVLVYMEQ